MPDSNETRYALYLENWDYVTGVKANLRQNSRRVLTTEYLQSMRNSIFCPECCAPLGRSPLDREVDSRGRRAFYFHLRGTDSECSLRTQRAEGRTYLNEELAQQAIDDEELVIVSGFIIERPQARVSEPRGFEDLYIEDVNGEITEVAIGRHNGQTFNLPSKITTVRTICRNFDQNYYRYYAFQGRNNAIQLRDLLTNVSTITEPNSTPSLYYGVITSSDNLGSAPHNIRQTMFEYNGNSECADFCLKVSNQSSDEHGIHISSTGRIVLMYGTVVINGLGLCLERLGWGEFDILPEQYGQLLLDS